MSEPPFTPAGRKWLKDQLERGCSRREIADILFQQGFSVEFVREKMGDSYPDEITRATGPLQPPPLVRKAPKNLRRVDTDKLELYVLEDFLSPKLCDQIAALLRHHLKPSRVAGKVNYTENRTSSTCYLGHLRSPVAADVTQRICRTLGMNPEYAEVAQAQNYEVGQQFRAHRDYFDFDSPYQQNGPERGNRTWTFMVYLNEGMGGGGTKFFAIDHTFVPKKGQAVIWNNLHPDGTPNHDTLHSGEPVVAGHKIIITKWFRENGSGPMFFEG